MNFLKKIAFIGYFATLFTVSFASTALYFDSDLLEEEYDNKKTFKQKTVVESTSTKNKIDSYNNVFESNNNKINSNNLNKQDNSYEEYRFEYSLDDSVKNEKSKIANKNDNFIFIGDSRTVGMSKIVDVSKYEFVTFIAESSKGYDWFLTQGLSKLEHILNTTDLNYNIVFNLGVNDLRNVKEYASLYNSLKEKYSQHNFFVASVNPGDEEKMRANNYNYTTNQLIKDFNDNLKSMLSEGIIFIDSFKYLQENGFDTTDGLHYTNDSSTKILDYLSDEIKNM